MAAIQGKSRAAFLSWAFLLFGGYVLPPSGEAAALRCRWQSPLGLDRVEEQDLTFAGNPLLVVSKGSQVELSPAAPPGDASGRPAGSVAVLRDGQPFREEPSLLLAAPEQPGSYYLDLEIAVASGRFARKLCILVPHPARLRRLANGFELSADGETVGLYPFPERSGNHTVRENPGNYQPPHWWLRLTDGNLGFEAVPGLAAGDLVQPSEEDGLRHSSLAPVCYPMWKAVLTLRNALENKEIPAKALRLISVFRAPAYNRGIGSGSYGRHIYGDAFDFYIRLSENSIKAADLSRDGRLDRRDAYPVVALIEDLQADGKIPLGGIGVYSSPGGDHEVTLHLDLRGHRATWGYFTGASGRKSEFAWASRRFAELDRRRERQAAERAAREGRAYASPRLETLP